MVGQTGGLKVYLDDERTPPEGWKLVRWPEEVIELLKTGKVTALSLDHDLGDESDRRTGYTVLQWLEKAVFDGFEPPFDVRVHSANVSARHKMELAIQSIRKLAKKNEKKRFNLNRSLGDFTWHNCDHSQGRPTASWTVCKTCAIAWAIKLREGELFVSPLREKNSG